MSASAACWLAVSVKGRAASSFARRALRRPCAPAGALALMLAHQGQRQLAGEQLVIGQPRDMRRFRVEIDRRLRVMDLGERRREAIPAALGDERRVQPFRQVGQACHRLADGAGQRLAGNARGHRIDRLDQRQAGEILFVDDVVRVDHGRAAVEPLDLAADIERRADRQRLFEIVAMGVEEGEGDLAGVVMGEDPPRNAPVAARRLLVTVDADLEGDDGAFRRQRDARLVAPVDDADGKVEEEIDDARRVLLVRPADQPAERDAELRPDAGKAGDRAEEGVEDVRAHGVGRGQAARPALMRCSSLALSFASRAFRS